MHTRRILCAALACGPLFLTACGGDSDRDTLAEPVATLSPAEAVQREQRALLTIEDVPAGFALVATSEGDGSSDGSDASGAGSEPDLEGVPDECKEFTASDLGDTSSDDSEVEFETADGTGLSHTTSYTDDVQTRSFMDTVKQPETPDCLRTLVLEGFEEGADDGSVSVDSSSLLRDSLTQDPDIATFSGTIVVSSTVDPSLKLTAKLRFEFKRNGPLVSMLLFFTFTDMQIDFGALTTRVDQRVAAALV